MGHNPELKKLAFSLDPFHFSFRKLQSLLSHKLSLKVDFLFPSFLSDYLYPNMINMVTYFPYFSFTVKLKISTIF